MKPFVCCLIGVSLVLSVACGAGEVEIDRDSVTSNTSACSRDGTHATVVGKFVQPVPSTGKTNVLILLSNCRWCADAMTPGGKAALTSEGTWTSARAAGDSTIAVDKTNSMFKNLVTSNGRSVTSYRVSDNSFAGFEYVRSDSAGYTCDGQ